VAGRAITRAAIDRKPIDSDAAGRQLPGPRPPPKPFAVLVQKHNGAARPSLHTKNTPPHWPHIQVALYRCHPSNPLTTPLKRRIETAMQLASSLQLRARPLQPARQLRSYGAAPLRRKLIVAAAVSPVWWRARARFDAHCSLLLSCAWSEFATTKCLSNLLHFAAIALRWNQCTNIRPQPQPHPNPPQ